MNEAQQTLLCISTSYPLYQGDLNGSFVKRLNELFLSQDLLRVERVIVLCFHRRPDKPTIIEQGSLERILPLSQLERLPKLFAQQIKVIIIPIASFGHSLQIGAPDALSQSPLQNGFGLALNMCRLWQAYHRVQSALKKLEVQAIVLAHWALPSAFISRNDRPIVYCHGGDVALVEKLPFSRLIARYLFKKSQSLVCVSTNLQKRIEVLCSFEVRQKLFKPIEEQKTLRSLHVIPMGIDKPKPCEQFKATLQEKSADLIVICTVGRLVPIKGYDLLVEALALLPKETSKQVIWYMAGGGPERETLVSRARAYQLNCRDLGQLDAAQRDALLSVSDLFIAPSRQIGKRVEGTPLALREAALSGCSIMATAYGGVAALLDHLPSSVVYKIDEQPKSIATSLNRFIDEHRRNHKTKQALLSQMQQRASQLWTWEALAKAHTQVLLDHYLLQDDQP